MTRSILILCFALCSASASASAQEHWVHITGVSWHDRPGYNNHNPGMGIETRMSTRWSAAIGAYHNSLYRTTVYAVGKYIWIDYADWQINVNIGGASGYEPGPIGPVLLPELCWRWVCSFYAPRIGSDTTAAAVIYLRIPVR